MTMIIDHIIENLESSIARAESPYYLIEALCTLDDVWPPINKKRFAPTYLGQMLIIRRERFVAVLGFLIYYRCLFERLFIRPFKSLFYGEDLIRIVLIILATPVLWAVSLFISLLWKLPSTKEETENPLRGSQSS